MTSLNTALDAVEQVPRGYDDVDWVDDVAQYQCTRCHKVLVNHYIANCLHKFCSNCKRILDDGSHRWKCPNCQQFIQDMDGQDLEFKNRVKNLRLHCPNRKYGCQHTCRFKHLKEHLEGCEHTRERALPVLYEGELTTQMLERMFTMEMVEVRREMAEMKQTILELKNRDKKEKSVLEGSWDLSVEVNEMRQRMSEMEKKQKDAKGKVRAKLSYVNDRIDGVKSDLVVETTRLTNDFKQLQKNEGLKNDSKNVSLVVEDNKSKILKLEGKAESYFEMIDFNNRKNNEQTQSLRKDLEKELKAFADKLQNASEEKELERVVAREKQNSENIAKLREKNDQDLQKNQSACIGQVEKCVLELKKVEEEMKKFGKSCGENKAEVDRVEADTKKILEELNEKVVKSQEEMERNATHFDEELKKLKNTIKKMRTPSALSSSSSKSQSENEVAKLSLPLSIPNIPQLTCFDLSVNNNFKPDLTWKIDDLSSQLQSMISLRSSWFKWTEYPITAQAQFSDYGAAFLSMRFDPQTPLSKLKLIPTIYYLVKNESGNVQHKSQSKSHLFTENLKVKDYDEGISKGLVKVEDQVAYTRTSIGKLYDTVKSNLNASVVIEIYIEPPSMLQQPYSHNGMLNWAIDKYGKRKQLAEKQLVSYQESPYFYTAPKGYRVQVLMFLECYVNNGQEMGVVAKIMFLRGEFDEDLPMTFPHSTTVTLLDRGNADGNVSVTEEKDLRGGAEYTMPLCSDKDLKTLIENDTLYYNVTIK